VKGVGPWFVFLSSYSPDLNPVEMTFATLKARIRGAEARRYDAPWRAVGQVCDLFGQEECDNFFIVAG
jgi:transposase